DGKWIAFTSTRSGSPQVWLVAAAGGEPQRLTWHPAPSFARGWTPDGARVLCASDRDAAPVPYAHLWTVPATGGVSTEIPEAMAMRGAYAPDGRQSRRRSCGSLGRRIPQLPRRTEYAARYSRPRDAGRVAAPARRERRAHHGHRSGVARRSRLLSVRPRLRNERVVVRSVVEAAHAGHALQRRRRQIARRCGRRPRARAERRHPPARPAYRRRPRGADHRARRFSLGRAALDGRREGDPVGIALAQRQARAVRGARRDLHRARREGGRAQPHTL